MIDHCIPKFVWKGICDHSRNAMKRICQVAKRVYSV